MFNMLRVKPPHGWNAVVWELGIVTLGVLIALGAQQLIEERSWRGRVDVAETALREELANHYSWSVEWRMAQPCILAQIDAAQQRVLKSGAALTPAPVFREDERFFTLRYPSKDYARSVWQAALADGVAARLDPAIRRELSEHYEQLVSIERITIQNDSDYQSLVGLSRSLPLDPGVRFTLVEKLDQLRARSEFMNIQSGQLIDHIAKVGMVPDLAKAKYDAERFGTSRFCKAHGLPMRSFNEARVAVPN